MSTTIHPTPVARWPSAPTELSHIRGRLAQMPWPRQARAHFWFNCDGNTPTTQWLQLLGSMSIADAEDLMKEQLILTFKRWWIHRETHWGEDEAPPPGGTVAPLFSTPARELIARRERAFQPASSMRSISLSGWPHNRPDAGLIWWHIGAEFLK